MTIADNNAPAMDRRASKKTCFVTLVTTEPYVVGALVLGHSLRATTTTINSDLVCMVTEAVSPSSRQALLQVFDRCVEVPKWDSNDAHGLALLGRPELGQTLTKLHIWRLTEYEKAVFLDADMLIVKDIGDVMERPELSACADIGWPDCFNSGLFVCVPSEATFRALVEHCQRVGTFDGGDQGLLNSFFDWWPTSGPAHRIPFTYNVTFTASYGYLPALQRFRDQVRAVHFIGKEKPWMCHRHGNHANGEFVAMWWAIHDRHVKGMLTFADRPAFSGYYNHGVGINNHHQHYNQPVRSQKSPSVDCDLASYRIKWSHEVEQYFAAKQHAAGSIIRKTTPVDDDPYYGTGSGASGLRMKPAYQSSAESLPAAFSNKARI